MLWLPKRDYQLDNDTLFLFLMHEHFAWCRIGHLSWQKAHCWILIGVAWPVHKNITCKFTIVYWGRLLKVLSRPSWGPSGVLPLKSMLCYGTSFCHISFWSLDLYFLFIYCVWDCASLTLLSWLALGESVMSHWKYGCVFNSTFSFCGSMRSIP